MTVSEIAKILNITEHAVRKRIETLHVKPRSREALYDPSVLIAIAAIKMGRPKKEKKKEGEK